MYLLILSGSTDRMTMSLLDLPDEILLEILGNLTVQDLHLSVSLVCKRLLRVAREPSVLKHINVYHKKDEADIEGGGFCSKHNLNNVMEHLAQRHDKVESLFLAETGLCKSLGPFTALKSLTILGIYDWNPDKCLQHLPDNILSNIQVLELPDLIWLKHDYQPNKSRLINGPKCLKQLAIGEICIDALNELLRIQGQNLTRLEVLHVFDGKTNRDVITKLDWTALEAACCSGLLKTLRFPCFGKKPSVIEKMKSLKCLELEFDPWTCDLQSWKKLRPDLDLDHLSLRGSSIVEPLGVIQPWTSAGFQVCLSII